MAKHLSKDDMNTVNDTNGKYHQILAKKLI